MSRALPADESDEAGGQQVNLAWDGFLKTSEAWAGAITGTVADRYDTHLRMDRRTVVGTAIDYGYDADNLLTRAGALTIGRHPQHGLESSTTVSNTTTSTLYNGFGEPQSWTANHPGGSLGFAYEYDALGRIVQRTEQNGTQTRVFEYAYDVVGRLTAVSLNGAVVEAYDYDPNGNRIYAENATGTLSAANIEHDAQDRLVRYGNLRFTYNLHGQLQTRESVSTGQVTQYTYDELGNLTRVQLHGGTVIDYLIDGFGRRIGKRVGGVLERGWIYQDQLNPIAELTGTGALRSLFVYGTKGHAPDLVLRDGRTYRVLTDHLGSVRRVVDAETGVIAQELDYDAWGRVLLDTNPGFQPFAFAGGLYDRDTRLVRFGARDYDAEIGRWTAKDPTLFGGGDGNLYSYVAQNPVSYIDPEGTFLQLAIRTAKGLKLLYRVGPARAAQAMKAGEGVYAATEAEARQFAQKYSTMCGGGGNVVSDSAKPGKFAHYHALDKAGERLPGHVWFGGIGALLFSILDADGDGTLTGLDVFELANPLPIPLSGSGGPDA